MLQEDPLRPAVVVDVGGGDARGASRGRGPAPELAAHVGDVRLGGDARVLAGLHRVLLGGQAEGVVAHRVQHVVAGHALEAGVDVGADVAERVPDVEAGAARVREHVEHVELARGRPTAAKPSASAPVGLGAQNVCVGLPPVLPLRLDLVRERGVVAVARARRRGAARRRRSWCGERTGPGGRGPPLVSCSSLGAVAQLVEHFHGMEGVRGSIPLSSTQLNSLTQLTQRTSPLERFLVHRCRLETNLSGSGRVPSGARVQHRTG